jgi:hypothetical protein
MIFTEIDGLFRLVDQLQQLFGVAALEPQRVDDNLFGLELGGLEFEDADDLGFRRIRFVQFLQQLDGTDLRTAGQQRSGAVTDFGGIVAQALEQQVFMRAANVLETNVGQQGVVSAAGLRNHLEQLLQRVSRGLAQFFDQRDALRAFQIVAFQELLQGSLEK